MNVYKINDVISCEFLKIPKAIFANERYRKLSSDAKLAYALLYDRLFLSKLNGWMNENDEVYLIYTREELAQDLGLTYKKAIAAFRELTDTGLICETRSGRGIPNKIYIVKPDLTAKQAKEYAKRENVKPAETAHLENAEDISECESSGFESQEENQDLPESDIKNFQNGISRPAETEVLDMPKSHTNQTYYNKTYKNHTEISQSVVKANSACFAFAENAKAAPAPPPFLSPKKVSPSARFFGNPERRVNYAHGEEKYDSDGRSDNPYSLDVILENCELERFDDEERKILYDALERLFYSKNLKIGNAILPQDKVRSRMYEITAETLRMALFKLHKNDKPIGNMTAYVMSVIFNSITEEYTILHIDPYLNSFRQPAKRE